MRSLRYVFLASCLMALFLGEVEASDSPWALIGTINKPNKMNAFDKQSARLLFSLIQKASKRHHDFEAPNLFVVRRSRPSDFYQGDTITGDDFLRLRSAAVGCDLLNLIWNKGQVCHEGIGCFANDERNKCKQLFVLPYGPDQMGASFEVYTPENGNGTSPQSIDYLKMSQMVTLGMNASRPLFVVAHGFSQTYPFGKFLRPMKDALIEKGNNVLLIDWVVGADYPNYYQAASNTRTVGGMLANVLRNLDLYKKAYMNKTTIIGFSTGAHVAAFAGKALTPKLLRSIVGLDPANWRFTNTPPECRLAPGDAQFVQVIHTNGGPSDGDEYGSVQPMGDADFYVNGGRKQKACAENKCSHDMSYVYYIESIRESADAHGCKFRALPCDSETDWKNGNCLRCSSNSTRGGCPIVGYETRRDTRGIFYLDTLSENKTHGRYCGAQYVFSLSSETRVKGEIAITLHAANGTNVDGGTAVFQSSKEILASKRRTRVVVFPCTIDTRRHKISLEYRKYSSWIWTDGPDTWTIEHAVLSGAIGTKHTTKQVLHRQLIRDGEPVIFDLISP